MTPHTALADPATDALWQMALIHRIMRRGFRRIDHWIADVPPEGTARAAAIAEHLDHMLLALHGHHSTEDTVIWPLLRERAPEASTESMVRQHQDIDDAATAVRLALTPWSTSPTSGNAAALRAALTTFRNAVSTHLDAEERDVVPLIARHVTAAEWSRVGEEGFRLLPPAYRFTAMGQMLEAATSEEAARMMADLPAPVRVMWPLIGRRRYTATMNALRGKPMPAALRAIMPRAGQLMVATYRRSDGRRMGAAKGLPILLATIPGRRTGREHTVSVVYLDREGSYVVVGSGGGAPREPQWFANLRAAEHVTVQVGADVRRVTVRVPERAERDRIWDDVLAQAPFFAKYQVKAQRLMPVALLTPVAAGVPT